MAPKSKSADASTSEMLKRRKKVSPLKKKLKVLSLIRKERNDMLRWLRSTVRKNLLFVNL